MPRAEDAEAAALHGEAYEEGVIDDAEDEEVDEEIIAEAEDTIDAAYADIDDVVAVVTDVWVVDAE